jgi:hypothetical protein
LAVGALTTAAFMGANTLYFDVQDFYKQNKEDFIRQPREQLKQAILQYVHNKKEGNISLNEKLGSPDPLMKEMTLKDAWESIFFLEEIEKYESDYLLLLQYKMSGKSENDFLATLDEENQKQFKEQKNKLDEKITLRVTYVEKSLGEDTLLA